MCSNCLAFTRTVHAECGLTLINLGSSAEEIIIDISKTALSEQSVLRNVLATEEYPVKGKKITVKLPAFSGSLLFPC